MRSILIALLWLFVATGAQASERYTFNGSIVEVATDGQQMMITYVTPAPGLNRAIQPGTLIFEGGINEKSKMLEGYAYAYDDCGRQKFWVSGGELDNGRVVQLVGLIGLRNKRKCKVGGFIERTTLQFSKQ